MLSTTVWEGMLGKESFAVLNAAISGQMGWRRVARSVAVLFAQLGPLWPTIAPPWHWDL